MGRSKDLYRMFCDTKPPISIFSQAWWLDATAGEENWDVALVEKNGKILASLPYLIKKKMAMTVISQPPLTQTLGPWLRQNNTQYTKALGLQKELMLALIGQLPDFHHYMQSWHYSQVNWLPFFWNGFKQSTNYTYILPDLSSEQVLWSGLQSNIKTDIRKATDRFNVRVREDLGLTDFLVLNRQVFARQGLAVPYSENLVRSIDEACAVRNARKIFIAEDDKGQRHAAVYLIWDSNSAYYLMGGGDPGLRNSGATSLCIWEAIKFAATVTKCFDFEGSMLEPVERFVRAFGAIQTPYFSVSKTPSKLLKTYLFFQELKSKK